MQPPVTTRPGSAAQEPRKTLWAVLLGAVAGGGAILALRPATAPVLAQAPAHAPPRARAPDSPIDPGRRTDPNRLGHDGLDLQENTDHAARGLASKRIIAGYGFWIFLLSDIIMFSAFFASYVVLEGSTAGGPAGRTLFDITNTAAETGLLLVSSFTCGIATIGLQARRDSWFYGAMAATFVLGASFVGLELHEFAGMVNDGNGPSRSAFLSGFFALVGLHGIHVTVGLLWLLTMMAQVWAKGYRADIMRRVMCFALFWHALDIVWVALFTVVYLMGVTS